jgi:polysaccharide biosynthesis transport protein
VLSAIALARRQLVQLEAGQIEHASTKVKGGKKGGSGATATLQAATLANKINQLESNLTISQVAQVDTATRKSATLTGPHPKSNAIFGFVIGLLLASFAAYLLGRLDKRMRSLAAIEAAFETQILTALPAVKRPIVRREERPAPAKTLREALWRLQTTLKVGSTLAPAQNGVAQHNGAVQPNGAPHVLLFVSADPGDGKSTLVAALALAQREAGERVAVIEADFRRPVQSRLLRLDGQQGLADVLAGRLTVEEAMQEVDLVRPGAGVSATPTPVEATTAVLDGAGSVSVLAGAGGVANPPALLARPNMAELPRSLAEDYDFVLIDAPGPLQVSDAIPLLAAVDGVVVVARVGHTRETSAVRLTQFLGRTPCAPVLGVVANAVPPADIRKYGVSEQYRRGLRQRLLGR